MQHRTCPICTNHAQELFKKGHVSYYQCTNCKTLFSEPLDNSNMVGGGNEEQRNKVQNPERLQRFEKLFRRKDINILDFGCGHGGLVKDLKEGGFNATGYDAYNPEFQKLPERDKYHLVSMVEVIEHISSPFVEIDVVHRSLLQGGVVYIETSFVDIAKDNGIDLCDFFYVDPSVGHATIFSHHGLDLLMALKGFQPIQHINVNVRLYTKK